jgi:hypothetical protein
MKKFLLAISLIILLTPSISFSSPFLSCDCTPATDKVLSFQLQFGTAAWISTPAVLTCGTINPVICTGDQRTICYDLSTIPAGSFTVKGRAVNAWEVSTDSLPFTDTKVVPTSPSLLRIVR